VDSCCIELLLSMRSARRTHAPGQLNT